MLLSLMGVTQVYAETADFENALPTGWEAVGTMTYWALVGIQIAVTTSRQRFLKAILNSGFVRINLTLLAM